MASIASEHVVSSQQKGRIVTQEDLPYEPGVRLYFDLPRILAAGLGVRDGTHVTKVRDHLPLHPYMVAAVGVDQVATADGTPSWTPRTFLEAANAYFGQCATTVGRCST